jgi:hypothetical protein
MRDVFFALFLSLSFSSLLFSSAQAALRITEIMYAPNTEEGEWVEIFNDGDEVVDIGKWVINDGTNHAIETNAPIPPGGRVIIADSKNNFLNVYPSVSVFSASALVFSDSGDTIILKDQKGVVYDTVSYTTTPNAVKNGKSLQLYNNSFYAGKPSPGSATAESIESESQSSSGTSSSSSSSGKTSQTGAITYLTPYRPWPADQYMYASFGGPKIGVAGGEISFEGRLISAEKKPVPAADLYWTFGDGGMEKGKNVKHIYRYPGDYYATLTATHGENIAEDMAKVTIIAPDISVSRVASGTEGFVEIFNETKEVLDLSGWVLQQGGINGLHFVIPKNTKIFGETKVIFPADITKLTLGTTTVALYFPNSKLVAEYNPATEATPRAQKVSEQLSIQASPILKAEENIFTQEKQKEARVSDETLSEVLTQEEFFSKNSTETQEKEVQEEKGLSAEEQETTRVAATGASEEKHLKTLTFYGFLSLLIIFFIILVFMKEKKESKEREEADSYEIIE